jgi:hypothetical protein
MPKTKARTEKFDAERYAKDHGADCLPMTEPTPAEPKYGHGGRRMTDVPKKPKE